MSTSAKISLAQYEAMVDRGEFEPREEHHVELIEGEIRPMSPISPGHRYAVEALAGWSFARGPLDRIRVGIQAPLNLPELESLPEPDLCWFRRDVPPRSHPSAADIFLLIEVSFSILGFDRGEKARLYARAGLADYWVVNLQDDRLEVFRDPGEGAYRSTSIHLPGDFVAPLAFPEVALPVALLIPEGSEGDEG